MRPQALILLALLLAGGALTWVGSMDEDVSPAAVLEMWGDVLRDSDQFGLKLTRLSDREEMQLGRDVARGALAAYSTAPAWEPYVARVGQELVPHLRRQGIHYEFHVLDAEDINAFALPGGQIFVFRGMLEFLQNEAELAAILGHEMAHVDARHCVERHQYSVRLKGLGQMADLFRVPITTGYAQFQELEADGQGVRMSIEAGYDPDAGAAVFRRMYAKYATVNRPNTPLEELARLTVSTMTDYFRSHPSTGERMRRLDNLLARNHSRLAGKTFYRGAQNFAQRVARAQKQFPGETVKF